MEERDKASLQATPLSVAMEDKKIGQIKFTENPNDSISVNNFTNCIEIFHELLLSA